MLPLPLVVVFFLVDLLAGKRLERGRCDRKWLVRGRIRKWEITEAQSIISMNKTGIVTGLACLSKSQVQYARVRDNAVSYVVSLACKTH